LDRHQPPLTRRHVVYYCSAVYNGRPVLLGDGLKIPKRGRKMPAVKLLHQVSDCHTKPDYIMGHSLQVVSVLVSAAATFFAVVVRRNFVGTGIAFR